MLDENVREPDFVSIIVPDFFFISLFAVRCAALPPTNGTFNMTVLNSYQSLATLKCDKGFNLNNIAITKCQGNGTWTRPLPSCKGNLRRMSQLRHCC